ncbi:DUF3048 domain-containing protein [Litorihabitans aurantiacus]|uniref:DUF3048 domain-containing protein n=1 Tax=Litorihabitans aurantiacus TaxID=1930061 RepID=A0AA37XFD4_9MICO|nr:DUF3048 domain-containing protein [Litorihabitans aurantiacus]GMA32399.1 hypothetical protein GCM10025875_23910 [Litorihabitans aurantiacus]
MRALTPAARAALAATLAIGLLAGCGGAADPEPTAATETVEPDTGVDKSAAPEPVLPATWPLTGVEGEIEERPAVAVKIENSPQARPQTGLEAADVVWEEMVEGGITRFNAVYHSQIPETVGPIRSVRPMDAGIAAPLQGLIAFSGGQGPFVQRMRDAGLQVLSQDEGAPGFSRSSERRAPHNVYGAVNEFLAAAEPGRPVPPAQFAFAPSAEEATTATAGAPAARLVTAFPQHVPSWDWDAEGGRWLRNEGSAEAVGAGGERLGATTVVVMRVEVVSSGALDPAGNPVPETVLSGSGEAIVASGGATVTGTWSKAGDGDPVVLTGGDGQPIQLAPGNVWVELVPTSGGNVEIS